MMARKHDPRPALAALAEQGGESGRKEVHVNLVINDATNRAAAALVAAGRVATKSEALRLMQAKGAERLLDEIGTAA